MQKYFKILFILFLFGCSKQPILYENPSKLLYIDKSQIEIDNEAYKEGALLGDEEKNINFTHSGKNFSRNGGHLFSSKSLDINWKTNLGKMKTNLIRFSSNIVASEKNIFSINANGEVIAVNFKDGKILWKTNIGDRKESNYSVPSGLAISGSNVFVQMSAFDLIALKAETGEILWRTAFRFPIISGPTVSEKGVLIRLMDGSIKFLDYINGSIIWSTPFNGNLNQNFPISYASITDTFVVMPILNNEFSVLDIANGKFIWNDNIPDDSSGNKIHSRNVYVILDKENIYVGNQTGGFSSFDQNLELMNWEILFGVETLPWLAGKSIFFISDNGYLISARKTDGKIRWKYQLPYKNNKTVKHFGPITASEKVYIISNDGLITVLDANEGKVLIEKQLKGKFSSNPIIVNGKIIIVSDEGKLISLG